MCLRVSQGVQEVEDEISAVSCSGGVVGVSVRPDGPTPPSRDVTLASTRHITQLYIDLYTDYVRLITPV